MAEKKRTKTRYVEVNVNKESFVSKIIGEKKHNDFSDIKFLRSILSNEKARILYALKHKQFNSIYALSKMLERDFKSVREDLKALERFGFIEFHSEKSGKRESLKPILIIDKIQVEINV